jgi:hypothetical protein
VFSQLAWRQGSEAQRVALRTQHVWCNMRKRQQSEQAGTETPLNLSHLRRDTRTALELAVVALAPMELISQLAGVAGLLEALLELPQNCPPVLALVPSVSKRGRRSLTAWNAWHKEHLAKVKA